MDISKEHIKKLAERYPDKILRTILNDEDYSVNISK